MDKIIVYTLVFINFITFVCYGIDKRKAVKGCWRISEKTLLLMGFAFGSIGQILGMKIFHHKTHKWYFRLCSVLFLILHIVILFMYFTKWRIL